MNIIQPQVSEIRQSAFFYDGVIATKGEFTLKTFQDGEISHEGTRYVGTETPKLAETDICDSDIDAEDIVDIFVDKFFIVTKTDDKEVSDDYLIFDTYDEGIKGLKSV